jgi:small subunit ribosomal protein S24e
MTFIHPSSVNNRKREVASGDVISSGEKQLFAYAEKRQNVSSGGSNAQMNLITTTRLEPLVYMLFGAYRLEVTERGLDCDGWLPVVGNLDALDDIQRLKVLMESCFLRVFEGITMAKRRRGRAPYAHREEEHESDYEDDRAGKELSMTEVKELDLMTRDIVRILNHYHEEYVITQPRQNSRPATPMGSPGFFGGRLPGGSQSGRSTPFTSRYTSFNSRPGTPSGLSSWM